MSALKYF